MQTGTTRPTESVTVSAEVELLTVREMARALGISMPTAYRWVRSGRVRSYELGPHATVVPRADVEKIRAERLAS